MDKIRVQSWSIDEAKINLAQRLDKVRKFREANYELGWKSNEVLLFKGNKAHNQPTLSYNSLAEVFQAQSYDAESSIHIPKVAQNLRFLHSQMSANPPSVIPQPTSNELEDRRSTQAADDLIQYGRKRYKLQEYVDLTSLSTLSYGTGFIKAFHDPNAGEILRDSEGGKFIEMAGDFKSRPILIWDFWFDPDALVWEDVKYTFERHLKTYSEAQALWPEHLDALMAAAIDSREHPSKIRSERPPASSVSSPEDIENTLVEIFEYTETALPENGMAGRRCFHLADGTILGELQENPHPEGRLPYGILTDIDIPGEVYGKTTVDFAIGLARVVDYLDSLVLNNIELHGSIKLVVYDQADTDDSNYTTSSVDIITVNGSHAHAPHHLKPSSVTVDIYNLRRQILDSIDGIMGVSELLQGQINREISGFASQTAMNAANMVRHRLFNKYTSLVEFIFETYLMSVQKNWKTKRMIKIVGKEDAMAVRYLSGADIAGGYMLSVNYGNSFSLDPAIRREEIHQSREILLEAGVNPKKIAQMLKYNEIDSLFDSVEIARKRQIEIFERAIEHYEKTGKIKIEPASKMRKAYHLEMAEAALEFVMTRDFLGLEDPLKEAIYSHIEDREQMAAQNSQPAMPTGLPAAPGQPPVGGPAPALPNVPDIGTVL